MTRIYTVARNGEQPRLVRAKSRSAALAHVAADFVVEHASQEACFELASKGVKLEDAQTQAETAEAVESSA